LLTPHFIFLTKSRGSVLTATWCMQVALTPTSTVTPGDPLTLRPGQQTLVAQLTGEAFTGNLTDPGGVASCGTSCRPPVVAVSYSPTVSGRCDPTSTGGESYNLIDASLSRDPSGRAFQQVVWSSSGAALPEGFASLFAASNNAGVSPR
jgi:hypothetical protein